MNSSNLKTLAKELVAFLSKVTVLDLLCVQPEQVSYHYMGSDDDFTVIVDINGRATIRLKLYHNTNTVYIDLESGSKRIYLQDNDFANIHRELKRLMTERYYDDLEVENPDLEVAETK